MLDLLINNPLIFLTFFPGLVLAITIHEFAHAWMADRLGDPTPRMQGRVTLNPLAHLDPLGTIAIILTRFGWGRPVEFDPYNLKNPLRDTALIAVAGPVSNILLAIAIAIVRALLPIDNSIITLVLVQLIYINIMLAIFNLIPIRPLDGEKIIYPLLNKNMAYEYRKFMDQWGLFVLIALIFPIFGGTSPAGRLISPIIAFLADLLI